MADTHADPLELLRRMQQESLARTVGLPQEVEAVELWSGVGFRLADMYLVSPLDHVREALPVPAMTPVPGVKPWVKGIANIRGNLYTVIDLAQYFGKPPVFVDDNARILVLGTPGLSAALIVNEVLGLRHFDTEVERQDLSGIDDPVLAHLTGAFLHDNVLWGVFDMKSLSESLTFRHVAA
jgi:twitching motility protein PilI